MTNKQLSTALRGLARRWRRIAATTSLGDQLDGDIDVVAEAAKRLAPKRKASP